MTSRSLWLVALAAVCAHSAVASADFLSSRERAAGKVTACSKYGEQSCATATLVSGKHGMMMRLKGGTLLDCEGDCRDTLRKATVDFWHDQRERSR